MAFKLRLWLAAGSAIFSSPAALAEGYFFQVDLARDTQSAVAAAGRGPISYGLNATNYDGGRSGALSVTYALRWIEPVNVKVGPTVGFKREDDDDTAIKAGGRISIERFTPAIFGSTYVLADVSSVYRSWFLLGQVTFDPANIGIELSRGGSDDYHETTLAVQKRLNNSPISLRLGYKLSSEEIFAGFSINTF